MNGRPISNEVRGGIASPASDPQSGEERYGENEAERRTVQRHGARRRYSERCALRSQRRCLVLQMRSGRVSCCAA